MASIFNLNGKTAIVTDSVGYRKGDRKASCFLWSKCYCMVDSERRKHSFGNKLEKTGNGVAFPIAAHIGKHEDLKKLVSLTTERFKFPS